MPDPIQIDLPSGATSQGFQQKNIFADMKAVVGDDVKTPFDVGAHRGEEAATFRQMFPVSVVYCFELTPERASHLDEAFASDGLVRIHEVALSGDDGEAILYGYPSDATNSLLPFDGRASRVTAQETIAVRRRDLPAGMRPDTRLP